MVLVQLFYAILHLTHLSTSDIALLLFRLHVIMICFNIIAYQFVSYEEIFVEVELLYFLFDKTLGLVQPAWRRADSENDL